VFGEGNALPNRMESTSLAALPLNKSCLTSRSASGSPVGHLILVALNLGSVLLFVMAVWCLSANLGIAAGFPGSSGLVANWLVWLSFGVLANRSEALIGRARCLWNLRRQRLRRRYAQCIQTLFVRVLEMCPTAITILLNF
jgi:hypothetical protein